MKKSISAVLLSILLITTLALGLSGCGTTSREPSVRSNLSESDSTGKTLDKTPDQSSAAGKKDTAAKTFTMDELKKYDGKDGKPAYVAVDGIVYDVSSDRAWHKGQHEEYRAGTDLTEDMANSPHGNMVLSNLPVVGKLAE